MKHGRPSVSSCFFGCATNNWAWKRQKGIWFLRVCAWSFIWTIICDWCRKAWTPIRFSSKTNTFIYFMPQLPYPHFNRLESPHSKKLASSPFKMQGSFPNQPAYYAWPPIGGWFIPQLHRSSRSLWSRVWGLDQQGAVNLGEFLEWIGPGQHTCIRARCEIQRQKHCHFDIIIAKDLQVGKQQKHHQHQHFYHTLCTYVDRCNHEYLRVSSSLDMMWTNWSHVLSNKSPAWGKKTTVP